jgi:adrenodoxin-NADP+ reductase
MQDAFTAADAIALDWHSNGNKGFLNGTREKNLGDGAGWEGVESEAVKRGLRRVTWSEWEIIDQAEKERGKKLGKERDKFSSVEEMLKIL